MKWLREWLDRRDQRWRDERLLTVQKVAAELQDGTLSAEAVFGGPAITVFAAATIQWFRETGGKNFVTCEVVCRKTGERFQITMQRVGGKSVAQELGELRALVAVKQP